MTALIVTPGVPEGWDAGLGGAPVTLRSRWIELAAGRIPGGYHTLLRPDGDGVGVAFGGGVMSEPTGHPRFDPYEVLSGRSAGVEVAEAGPHPWKERAPEELFPCCLLMYPNYETAPVGSGRADPAALRGYLDDLIGWCADQGLRSIAALYLHPDPPELAEALLDAGFEILPMVDRAELAVEWTDFDGYLASLPKKRRAAVRGELRALAARGVVIDERPLRADEPELIRLRGNLVEKYGGTADADREAGILAVMRDTFGDDLSVFEARLDGRMLCFGLFIRDEWHWTGLMTGSDYDDPDSSFAYFATFFYEPAAAAPRHGITRISYGLGSLQAKRLRGCALRTLYAACRTIEPGRSDV